MRIIFTGARDHDDPGGFVKRDLMDLLIMASGRGAAPVWIHGAAPGLDTIVDMWAGQHPWIFVERYRANFAGPCGRASGPIRNQYMVSLGAGLCLAYPKGESKGTRGCVAAAQKAKIRTLVTEYGAPFVPLAARLRGI